MYVHVWCNLLLLNWINILKLLISFSRKPLSNLIIQKHWKIWRYLLSTDVNLTRVIGLDPGWPIWQAFTPFGRGWTARQSTTTPSSHGSQIKVSIRVIIVSINLVIIFFSPCRSLIMSVSINKKNHHQIQGIRNSFPHIRIRLSWKKIRIRP